MVGRIEEKKRIKQLLASKRSEFLAITGRRRVGKTFLIDALLREHFCFSMTGIQEGKTREQLINFGVKLSEYSGTDTPATPPNWQVAFLQLKTYLKTLKKNRKHVIFIDELPWVYTARSRFVQMLAHFWNDYLSKESCFLLVVCGSATSWITKNVINDPGGLHNRVTEVIHLHPFSLSETKAFLATKSILPSAQEIARIYMALGGIPFYLEHLRRGESFAVAIERICFTPGGILRNEYNNLYQALFNHADIHQSIVGVLAKHPYGMTHRNIQKKLGIRPSGSYQRAMQELIVSDFIMETTPMGKKKRGAFFRLIDEFSIFYHRFMKPNRKYTPGMWQQMAATQAFKTWQGYAFESLCLKHIQALKRSLGISAVYTEISSLYVPGNADQPGFQVDLLIERKDHSINFCEIKFQSGPYSLQKEDYLNLIRKRQKFLEYTGTRKDVYLTLITNYGVVPNEYAQELIDAEITLEDILAP